MDKTGAVRDYYYILGVSSNASSKQIQVAYDELYAKFGPHVSAEELDPDAMAKAYRDISEAYEVLMDPQRRQEYDRRHTETKATTNELRDLWMKKTGVNPALDEPAEPPTPTPSAKPHSPVPGRASMLPVTGTSPPAGAPTISVMKIETGCRPAPVLHRHRMQGRAYTPSRPPSHVQMRQASCRA